MFTKWFKNCIKGMIACAGGGFTLDLPVKNVSNTTYYFGNMNTYPGSVTATFATTATNSGIHVGTGNTAATENDYALESPITSGMSGVVTVNKFIDASTNNPCVTYNMVLTNTTSSDVVVKEVGFYQQVALGASAGATSTTNRTILVDRTVLDTPVTVPANGNAAIYYTLKTSYDFES